MWTYYGNKSVSELDNNGFKMNCDIFFTFIVATYTARAYQQRSAYRAPCKTIADWSILILMNIYNLDFDSALRWRNMPEYFRVATWNVSKLWLARMM